VADPARLAAATASVRLAARFPDLPLIEPEIGRLSDADARLCTAIHRHSLQRWLTIEAVLQGALRQPAAKLDPVVRGVLVNAGAQLLFMDRLPDYAVIDGAVALTRKLDRKRATGLVNTTLRKVAGVVAGRDDGPWTPAADALPWPGGASGPAGSTPAVVRLTRPLLPKPDNLLAHLSVAASLPLPLLQRWFALYGREQAAALALQSLASPPTYVVEDEAPRRWDGTHADLVDFLAAVPARRVQDPASLASVAAAKTAGVAPARVLDLCAGRGTKSRQLANVFPDAQIDAWDPDAARAADLNLAADTLANLHVLDAAPAARPDSGSYDLVVLDVPCSNTGVLARRPGARYRATARARASLVALQRTIIKTGLKQLVPGGHVLYCTCSIDPEENQQQAQWLLGEFGAGAALLAEDTLLPCAGPAGHDGSYHAVVRTPSR